MNLEDFKRLHEAMVIPSQGPGSLFRDVVGKMFEKTVQLERAATRALLIVGRL